MIDRLVEQLIDPNRQSVTPRDCSTLCRIAMRLATMVQNNTRDQIVLQPLIAELHKVNTLANRSDWNPAPPVVSAPTPASAVVDTTSPRSPMEPIPEDGTPDLFEDLQNLPATPTPPTDQSMATSLS